MNNFTIPKNVNKGTAAFLINTFNSIIFLYFSYYYVVKIFMDVQKSIK